MITHFLSDEQVTAYSRDFADRLLALGPDFPKRWIEIGESGDKMAERLLDLLPDEISDKVLHSRVSFDRKTDAVVFEDAVEGTKFGTAPVLVIDSAVHSGRSMLATIEALTLAGARKILSYTLVLKRGSQVIPSFFGVLIDDKDRAYFDLKILPNNRLHSIQAFGTLREIAEKDSSTPISSMDTPFKGTSTGDLLYDKEALSFKVYVYEIGKEIAGFVTFKKIGHDLFLDELGVPKKFNGKKISGALMRWAETWARSNLCDSIELWAYENVVGMYQKKLGYELADTDWKTLGDQRYRVMRKKILYNVRPRDE